MKDAKPSVKEFTQVCREHFVPGTNLSIATLEAKLPSELVAKFKSYPGGMGNLLGLWSRQNNGLSKTDRQEYSKAGRPVSVYLYSGERTTKTREVDVFRREVVAPTKLPTVKLLQQAMDLIEEALEQLGVEARAQKKLDELKAILKDT